MAAVWASVRGVFSVSRLSFMVSTDRNRQPWVAAGEALAALCAAEVAPASVGVMVRLAAALSTVVVVTVAMSGCAPGGGVPVGTAGMIVAVGVPVAGVAGTALVASSVPVGLGAATAVEPGVTLGAGPPARSRRFGHVRRPVLHRIRA